MSSPWFREHWYKLLFIGSLVVIAAAIAVIAGSIFYRDILTPIIARQRIEKCLNKANLRVITDGIKFQTQCPQGKYWNGKEARCKGEDEEAERLLKQRKDDYSECYRRY